MVSEDAVRVDQTLHRRRLCPVVCHATRSLYQGTTSVVPPHYYLATTSHASAITAAATVLRKLTESLFIQPLRSRAAPRRLSTSVPVKPATATIPIELNGIMRNPAPTSATANDATLPAVVPAVVIPPSVPAGTRRKLVISQAREDIASPHSLDAVSPAASASAASAASANTLLHNARALNIAAAPILASTCPAFLPWPLSAILSCCFSA